MFWVMVVICFHHLDKVKDYVEIHIHDKNHFKEKVISEHTRFEDGQIFLNIGQDLRDNGYDRGTLFVYIILSDQSVRTLY